MIRSILHVSQVVQNAISRPPTYHHHQHNERSHAQASNNYANRTAMITSMCTSVAEVHRDQRHHTNGKPQPNNRKESPNNRHHDQHVNQNQNTTTMSQRPSIYHVNVYARLVFIGLCISVLVWLQCSSCGLWELLHLIGGKAIKTISAMDTHAPSNVMPG